MNIKFFKKIASSSPARWESIGRRNGTIRSSSVSFLTIPKWTTFSSSSWWPQFHFLFIVPPSLPLSPVSALHFSVSRELGGLTYWVHWKTSIWGVIQPSDTRALFLGHWHISVCSASTHYKNRRNSRENENENRGQNLPPTFFFLSLSLSLYSSVCIHVV